MPKIARDSLMTLEAYAKVRTDFRARVLAHKKNRTVHLGAHVTLIFEDELTMRYQILEMLRVEKIFEESGIQNELDAYNPLIPDGGNWKATMMIEYPDVDERQRMLGKLIGIEDRVWARVAGFAPMYAVADEDLDRSTDERPPPCIFCALKSTAACGRRFNPARRWRWGWIIRPIVCRRIRSRRKPGNHCWTIYHKYLIL